MKGGDILTALCPRDDSALAIRNALIAIARSIDEADARRLAALDNRRESLRDRNATSRDVIAFETLAKEAEIEVERLQVLCADLEVRLGQAVKAERAASHQATIDRARVDLADAVGRFEASLDEYAQTASVIADVIGLGHELITGVAAFGRR